jgi:hypothetical protein
VQGKVFVQVLLRPYSPPLFIRFSSFISQKNRHSSNRWLDTLPAQCIAGAQKRPLRNTVKEQLLSGKIASIRILTVISRTFIQRWTDDPEYCVHQNVPKGKGGRTGRIFEGEKVEYWKGLFGGGCRLLPWNLPFTGNDKNKSFLLMIPR